MDLVTVPVALVALTLALLGTLWGPAVWRRFRRRSIPSAGLSGGGGSGSPRQPQFVPLEAVVRDLADRVERIELRQAAWKAELNDLTEGILEALERVESKRKRVAAAESRANAKEQAAASAPPLTGDRKVDIGTYRAMRVEAGI